MSTSFSVLSSPIAFAENGARTTEHGDELPPPSRPRLVRNSLALEKLDLEAETLLALAEAYDIRVEELIRWIHNPDIPHAHSGWRAYCVEYADLRRRLGLENAAAEARLPKGWPD